MGIPPLTDELQPASLHQLSEAVLGLLFCQATERYHLAPGDPSVGLYVSQDRCLGIKRLFGGYLKVRRQAVSQSISLKQPDLRQFSQYAGGVRQILLQQRRQCRGIHRAFVPHLPQGQ